MESGFSILFLSFILTVGMTALIPFMTRKTENFGVSIPESIYDRDDFRKMRKKYALTLISSGILMCFIIGLLSLFVSAILLYIVLIALLVYIALSFFVYLPLHFKMKEIKRTENWYKDKPQTIVIDMKFRDQKLVFSNWWFLVPFVIIVVTIAITFIWYDTIPDQIPMHTDFNGNVTYEKKSVTNLLFLPGTQLFLLLLFVGINSVIKHSKQQVSVENREKSKQQNMVFRRRWSAYMIITTIIMQLMLSYMQFSFMYPSLEAYIDIVIIGLVVILLLGTLILALKTGQGGSRIHIDTNKDDDKLDRDDDRYWKLGQFYVNRSDPALFVEKRFGVGWTNNWGHPLSWLCFIGVIAIPIIITWIFV